MSKSYICVGLVAVEVLTFEVCQCRSYCFWGPPVSKLSLLGLALCRSYGFVGVSLCRSYCFGGQSVLKLWGASQCRSCVFV